MGRERSHRSSQLAERKHQRRLSPRDLRGKVAISCTNKVICYQRLPPILHSKQVQEDFGIGFGEVHRARATERVAIGTKDVAERTAKAMGTVASATVSSVQDLDQRLKISERAGNTFEAVKESTVVQSTAAALTKAGTTVKSATVKVFEQPAVASATEAVGSGFKKFTSSLTNFTGMVTGRSTDVEQTATAAAGGSVPAADVLRSNSPLQAGIGNAPGSHIVTTMTSQPHSMAQESDTPKLGTENNKNAADGTKFTLESSSP